MAINRDKVLREAEKLVQKGRIELAIREYEKLLKVNPSDANTINRVGDLYGRVGQVDKAIELYERIADNFTQDGFIPKAIAILKKINRLAPQRLDIFEKLADLYIQQGLMVEAKSQYQVLAEWYQKNNDVVHAIGAHQKLVQLDPNNHMAHLRLADLLLKHGDADEAVDVYDRLGRMLLARDKLDEAERLYRHALDQTPPSGDFVAPLIEAMLDAGRSPAARDILSDALRHSPASEKLKALQVRTALVFGETDKALGLAHGLDSDDKTTQAMVGRALLKAEQVEEARELLVPAAVSRLDAGEFAAAQELLEELVKALPRDRAVLETAVRAWRPAGPSEVLTALTTSLADCYLRVDERDKAKALYEDLVTADPGNQAFRQRLVELGGGDVAAVAEPSPTTASTPVSTQAEPSAAEVSLSDEVEIEFEVEDSWSSDVSLDAADAVSVDEGYSVAAAVEFAVESSAESAAAAPAAGDQAQADGFDAEERFAEAGVFAKYGLIDKAIHHLEDVVRHQPDHLAAGERLATLYAEQGRMDDARATGQRVLDLLREQGDHEAVARLVESVPALGGEPAVEVFADGDAGAEDLSVSDDFVVIDVDEESAEEPAGIEFEPDSVDLGADVEPIVFSDPAGYEPTTQDDMEATETDHEAISFDSEAEWEELAQPREDEPEFAIDADLVSGLGAAIGSAERAADAAISEIDALERSLFGRSAGSKSVPTKHQKQTAPTDAEPVADAEMPEDPTPSESGIDDLVELTDSLVGPSTGDVEQLDFFIQQELLDDALVLLSRLEADHPDDADLGQRRLILKQKGVLLDQMAPPVEEASEDLFADEEDYIDLAAELEQELAAEEAMVDEATGRGKDEALLEEVFREFQKGVAEQLSEEDADTHFNLGIAYKEMGLLPEAIREFQISSRDDAFFVESCSMIGVCYVEQGMPDRASEWYQKALVAPELEASARMALRYDLAAALESAGEHDQAADLFAELLTADPGYRDVAERLSDIGQQRQAN
jgi:tetratricopeptide (TPR) repeat protein